MLGTMCDCIVENLGQGCFCLCSAFMQPLGGLVLLSCLMGISMISIAGSAFSTGECLQNNSMTKTALFVDLGLAAFHIFFAIYIQWKLIKTIAGEDEDSTQGMGLAKRMWNIVLYDFVFCIYLPVAFLSFVFGCIQPAWAYTCIDESWDGGGAAWFAGIILVVYGCSAASYLCCWSCLVSCSGLTQRSFRQARSAYVQQTGQRPHAGSEMAAPMAVAQPVIAQPPQALQMPP